MDCAIRPERLRGPSTAMLSDPGADFSSAISSGNVLALTSGLTRTTWLLRATIATGVKSFRIVGQLLERIGVHDKGCGGGKQEGVSVRRGARDRLGADEVGGAGPVLDDE